MTATLDRVPFGHASCPRASLARGTSRDPASGELWGNYPQTYSLVGMINCAVLLSKPWSAIR